MSLLFFAYLAGMLTILSPCVLPVLPFVFARADAPFYRSGLPTLIGMALTFTLLAGLAVTGGAWLVAVNHYGRYVALCVLLLLGLMLLYPALGDRLLAPLMRWGGVLQQRADQRGGLLGAGLLGVALGFLWAPCAGPILGLILAGVALQGLNAYSLALLLSFALGAASSLVLALLAGKTLFTRLKKTLVFEHHFKRGLGLLVIIAVVILALGWDSRYLAKLTPINTADTEQTLLDKLQPATLTTTAENIAPELVGATGWLNSQPLSLQALRGKVVLLDFWTYSCINCLRTLPYLKAWQAQYQAAGFTVIGIHAPEFAFEKVPANVARAVKDLGITYPVALDNDFAIWNAYHNQYWPAHYLIDAQGRIRHTHFGEGGYQETEQHIRQLLQEAGRTTASTNQFEAGSGALAAASSERQNRSPETYLGYERSENFAATVQKDLPHNYHLPRQLDLHHWGLQGTWQIGAQSAQNSGSSGAIAYRFKGRDVHLVLANSSTQPLRFKVTLDGHAPGSAHGADIAADGNGIIDGQRLYQLIRLGDGSGKHLFRIEFLDAGAEAFAFTFG
jgi:cytochrome c biogenesis protein CcdA/thiol-disulfide isomerase/thioredoxin